MNGKRAAATAMSALVLVGFATSCEQSSNGEATAEPAPTIGYHPCDDLPIEAIKEARIDARPPSRSDHESTSNFACMFTSHDPYYGITIAARGDTIEDIRQDDRFEVVNETEIGGRHAVVGLFLGGSCSVAVDIAPGVLDFEILYSEGSPEFTTANAACDQATRVATALAPYFPDHL
ncbi:DUF3558 domain-containing protein [Rhodococcus sp. USK10]|uniref:DUF3558 domain-containing protein n=1 Tax=Rhodococcus sp. USK10 TaxID=2789739 RepID=UPI002151EB46|nr:DUF3558 domain-containing protein [Rhodococcus sp. USK10]